jgi:exonuclease SbcC
MRPVRLELQGFSAFRDLTVIDFSDIELVALVGPTGSGKSSIIDAMTFALYGSAARYDERLVAPVINQLSTEARVRLDFEVGSKSYSATRIVRRTKAGGATTREARLERGSEVLAADAKAVSDTVTALLGLDFERFNKTVVLPQGKFSEFLHDKPATRQQLLRELLGLGVYERIGRTARDRAKTLQNEAGVLEATLSDLGDLSDERLEALQLNLEKVVIARKEIGVLTTGLATIELRVQELDGELAGFTRTLELLDGVRVPDDVEELTVTKSNANSRRQETAALRDQARAASRAAVDAVANGPSVVACRLLLADYDQLDKLSEQLTIEEARLTEGRTALAAATEAANAIRDELARLLGAYREASDTCEVAEAAVGARGDRAQLQSIVERYERQSVVAGQLIRLRSQLSTADEATAEAKARREKAKGELEALERLGPAVALAEHLAIGEPCPVCLQTVHATPEHHGLDKKELNAARSVSKAAEEFLQEAISSRSKVEATVNASEEELAGLSDQLTGQLALEAVREQLDELRSLTLALEEARKAANNAERARLEREAARDVKLTLDSEAKATREVAAAEARTEQVGAQVASLVESVTGKQSRADAARDLDAAEALDEARREATRRLDIADDEAFGTTRDLLAALKPPLATDSLAVDWTTLVEWCRDRSAEVAAKVARAATDREEALDKRTEFVASIRQSASKFLDHLGDGPDGGVSFAAAIRDGLADVEARARSEADELNRDRERAAKSRTRISQLVADAQVATLLGHLLRADGFQRWLMEEALADLVVRATVRLQTLTNGQYSLSADDGAFKIIDHRNADEIRDARSLSGGETFLASLALALALADSSMDLAAEGTAQIDSIFLDEGFGTLDSDALDIVAGTIEELGATGRLVGIVTHIRELAERMPVRFEVTKGAITSTVERVET